MWVTRHALASAIVVVAATLVTGVFVFARPQYRPENPTTSIDMSRRHDLLNVQQVRAAFAAHGIRLDHSFRMRSDARGTWAVELFAVPAPVDVTHVVVSVFGPRAKVGWSKQDGYDTIFRNVGVTYGGKSADVLARTKAAVADLSH